MFLFSNNLVQASFKINKRTRSNSFHVFGLSINDKIDYNKKIKKKSKKYDTYDKDCNDI